MSSINLLPCLTRLAQLQKVIIDRLALQKAVGALEHEHDSKALLQQLARQLNLDKPKWFKSAAPGLTPALLYSDEGEWGLLLGLNAQNQWIAQWWDSDANQWDEVSGQYLVTSQLVVLNLERPSSANPSWLTSPRRLV